MTALLDLESERRVLEQEQELEELRRARTIRAELTLPVPEAPLWCSRAAEAETEARLAAANVLIRWWQERPNKQGRVTNAQIARLARQIRGMGRGRD